MALTAVLAVATIVLAVYTLKLWKTTVHMVQGTENTSQRQLRAYVGLEGLQVRLSKTFPGAPADSASAPTSRFTNEIALSTKNFGQTPAHDLVQRVNWMPLNGPLPKNYAFTEQNSLSLANVASNSMVYPGEVFSGHVPIPDVSAFARARDDSTQSVVIYGHIEFTDIFKMRRRVNFCRIYSPHDSPSIVHCDQRNQEVDVGPAR